MYWLSALIMTVHSRYMLNTELNCTKHNTENEPHTPMLTHIEWIAYRYGACSMLKAWRRRHVKLPRSDTYFLQRCINNAFSFRKQLVFSNVSNYFITGKIGISLCSLWNSVIHRRTSLFKNYTDWSHQMPVRTIRMNWSDSARPRWCYPGNELRTSVRKLILLSIEAIRQQVASLLAINFPASFPFLAYGFDLEAKAGAEVYY